MRKGEKAWLISNLVLSLIVFRVTARQAWQWMGQSCRVRVFSLSPLPFFCEFTLIWCWFTFKQPAQKRVLGQAKSAETARPQSRPMQPLAPWKHKAGQAAINSAFLRGEKGAVSCKTSITKAPISSDLRIIGNVAPTAAKERGNAEI